MRIVREHPLAAFMVLAYVFSWLVWPLYLVDLSPSPLFGAGPFFAAVVVVVITGGRSQLRVLFGRMLQWRTSILWYAVVLLLPIAVATSTAVLNVFLGADVPRSGILGDLVGVVPSFLFLLLVPGVGGAWEEPGWRGYALPRLQEKHSALAASLIVGVFWALWHFPLWWAGIVPWSDAGTVVAISVVFAWIFNSTGGSVLLVMLFHAWNNAVSGGVFGGVFSGADSQRYWLLLTVMWGIVAITVVIAAGPAGLVVGGARSASSRAASPRRRVLSPSQPPGRPDQERPRSYD